MSEKLDHISPKAMEDAVNEAWRLLATAIELRDNLGVPSEVIRVARALCQASNGNPDALVHYGMPQQPWRGSERWAVVSDKVCMAWTYFGYQARCAITNMEAHRQEEADHLKQQEEKVTRQGSGEIPGFSDLKAVDIPVGFSGMNEEGIKGEYRILDILDRLERGKKFRAEAGTETYIKMIEEDRNELLRRLIASKLVPPYTVPPRRSLQ